MIRGAQVEEQLEKRRRDMEDQILATELLKTQAELEVINNMILDDPAALPIPQYSHLRSQHQQPK